MDSSRRTHSGEQTGSFDEFPRQELRLCATEINPDFSYDLKNFWWIRLLR